MSDSDRDDYTLTPFNEDGSHCDLAELGFQPVGSIRDNGPTIVRGDDGREYIHLNAQIRIPGAANDGLVCLIPALPNFEYTPVVISSAPPTRPSARAPVDIVDRIDELVNDQLTQESSGYDHNINQPKCPHCGREWHGLKITQRIESMRITRMYDESYSYADDDTPVLCGGSEFIGPMRYPPAATISETINRIQSNICGFTWVPLTAPGVTEHPDRTEASR